MKSLKNLTSKALSSKEMAEVGGGWQIESGGSGFFKCYCNMSVANPPYKDNWSDYYTSIMTMQADLDKRCTYGGTCDRDRPW